MLATKGKEIQTEGIVLRVLTLREDDLFVDLMTPHQGRLWGVARHGRKSHKRFGTVLEPLNIVRLRFRDRGGFVDLEEAGMEFPLNHLDQNLITLLSSFYLIDLVREFAPERSADPNLYKLLRDSLLKMNQRLTPREVISAFEKRLLEVCGYGLNLGNCQSCERDLQQKENFYFVYREGGIFCQVCVPHGNHEIFTENSIYRILPRFIEYQLGHSPKSRKLLTQAGLSY